MSLIEILAEEKVPALQMAVEDAVVALDLAATSVHGIGNFFRRRVLEMTACPENGLSPVPTKYSHDSKLGPAAVVLMKRLASSQR